MLSLKKRLAVRPAGTESRGGIRPLRILRRLFGKKGHKEEGFMPFNRSWLDPVPPPRPAQTQKTIIRPTRPPSRRRTTSTRPSTPLQTIDEESVSIYKAPNVNDVSWFLEALGEAETAFIKQAIREEASKTTTEEYIRGYSQAATVTRPLAGRQSAVTKRKRQEVSRGETAPASLERASTHGHGDRQRPMDAVISISPASSSSSHGNRDTQRPKAREDSRPLPKARNKTPEEYNRDSLFRDSLREAARGVTFNDVRLDGCIEDFMTSKASPEQDNNVKSTVIATFMTRITAAYSSCCTCRHASQAAIETALELDFTADLPSASPSCRSLVSSILRLLEKESATDRHSGGAGGEEKDSRMEMLRCH
ncbi:unnamed protein product [Vitrella brassicaformis CCMP3155]|uniref:Uncharacterized protein n=1 Tax=Vitrella brassicaformis (strain CCMP3155) TaxID=1169540 RepID=A0A0G4H0B0_VITBC|nr:unnamed protein product [Vitrella brassicaformis CCMP3155]|eukprot:CEM36846.1 unnamed protein product [Vitrella brassicaformis CCMP3155]